MNDIVSPWRYITDLRASNQEKNVFLGQTPRAISSKVSPRDVEKEGGIFMVPV
jgi:hypothetical protein